MLYSKRWITNFMMIGLTVVTKVMSWLETQKFCKGCSLKRFMRITSRKILTGWAPGKWLVSVEKSELWRVTFIFVTGLPWSIGGVLVDHFSSIVAIACGRFINLADIWPQLGGGMWIENWRLNKKSTSVSQLLDLVMKYDAKEIWWITTGQERLVNLCSRIYFRGYCSPFTHVSSFVMMIYRLTR